MLSEWCHRRVRRASSQGAHLMRGVRAHRTQGEEGVHAGGRRHRSGSLSELRRVSMFTQCGRSGLSVVVDDTPAVGQHGLEHWSPSRVRTRARQREVAWYVESLLGKHISDSPRQPCEGWWASNWVSAHLDLFIFLIYFQLHFPITVYSLYTPPFTPAISTWLSIGRMNCRMNVE